MSRNWCATKQAQGENDHKPLIINPNLDFFLKYWRWIHSGISHKSSALCVLSGSATLTLFRMKAACGLMGMWRTGWRANASGIAAKFLMSLKQSGRCMLWRPFPQSCALFRLSAAALAVSAEEKIWRALRRVRPRRPSHVQEITVLAALASNKQSANVSGRNLSDGNGYRTSTRGR